MLSNLVVKIELVVHHVISNSLNDMQLVKTVDNFLTIVHELRFFRGDVEISGYFDEI